MRATTAMTTRPLGNMLPSGPVPAAERVAYVYVGGLGHMTLDAGGKDTFLRPVSSTV